MSCKSSQGFVWGQKWFSSASPIQGVGSGCDNFGIKAQISTVLGSLWSHVNRVLVISVKCDTCIIRRLRHLVTIILLSYTFSAIECISIKVSSYSCCMSHIRSCLHEEMQEVFQLEELLNYRIKGYLMHRKYNPKERPPMPNFVKLSRCWAKLWSINLGNGEGIDTNWKTIRGSVSS